MRTLAYLAVAASLLFVMLVILASAAESELSSQQVEERTLDDGSIVHLNRGAQIKVDFTPTERRLILRNGEAHFSVRHNTDRPFVVRAVDVRISALGSVFDVAIDADAIRILVTEGIVRINTSNSFGADAGFHPLVSAGELAVVDLRQRPRLARVSSLSAGDVDRLLSWRPRTLNFIQVPLREVVAALNSKNQIQMLFVDPELESLQLTISLRSDDVESLVRVLEQSFGINVERKRDTFSLKRRT